MTGIIVLVVLALIVGAVMSNADKVAVLLKRGSHEMEFRAYKNKLEAAKDARLRRMFEEEQKEKATKEAEVTLFGETQEA